jgi:membrane associated rhomboid family serine protease
MGLHNRDYMRDPAGSMRAGEWARRAFSVVGVVMVACVAVFAVQMARGWRGFDESPPFQLQVFWEDSWPLLRAGEWWRLLSYAFVHGGPVHLIFNLFGLFLFGRLAWQEFGNRHWLGIFFAGAVGGAVAYLAVFHQENQRLAGASAGVYALLTAVTLRMPDLPLGIPFLPGITLRLRNFTLGVLLFELVNTLAQSVALAHPATTAVPTTHVASLAHLGGALAGYLYVRLMTDGFDSMVRESERRERLWREQQQQQRRRREPRHVAAGKFGAPPPEEPEEPPRPVNFMEDQVNPILEKLHAHGAASLSPEEKHILDEAARRLRAPH